jgi:hypothetical protein
MVLQHWVDRSTLFRIMDVPVYSLFKAFHGKLFVDLQMLLVAPDSTKPWTPARREMHFGPFACAAAIDHPATNTDITGQLPELSHLHAAL